MSYPLGDGIGPQTSLCCTHGLWQMPIYSEHVLNRPRYTARGLELSLYTLIDEGEGDLNKRLRSVEVAVVNDITTPQRPFAVPSARHLSCTSSRSTEQQHKCQVLHQ